MPPPYRAGKTKMLAVGSVARRLPEIPEVPATAETLPGYEAVTWFGLFTTAGAPPPSSPRSCRGARALFNEQAFIDRFIAPNMFETTVTSPEEFAAVHQARQREVVQGAEGGEHQGRLRRRYFTGTIAVASISTSMPGRASWLMVSSVCAGIGVVAEGFRRHLPKSGW